MKYNERRGNEQIYAQHIHSWGSWLSMALHLMHNLYLTQFYYTDRAIFRQKPNDAKPIKNEKRKSEKKRGDFETFHV